MIQEFTICCILLKILCNTLKESPVNKNTKSVHKNYVLFPYYCIIHVLWN